MISGTFKNFLFTGAIFERIFPPRGEPYDFANSCFPYTFGPTFMPPIRFGGYSSSNSNQFLPHCDLTSVSSIFEIWQLFQTPNVYSTYSYRIYYYAVKLLGILRKNNNITCIWSLEWKEKNYAISRHWWRRWKQNMT